MRHGARHWPKILVATGTKTDRPPLCFACFEGRHAEHTERCLLFAEKCACPKCIHEPAPPSHGSSDE